MIGVITHEFTQDFNNFFSNDFVFLYFWVSPLRASVGILPINIVIQTLSLYSNTEHDSNV